MVEEDQEVLRNPGVEEFVKSTREASEVLIVQRHSNKVGHFLEVVAHVVEGWRRIILQPEGCDRRGWGRVSRQLSKVLASFEYGESSPDGKRIGKNQGAGLGQILELPFLEEVRSVVGGSAEEKGPSKTVGNPLGKDRFDSSLCGVVVDEAPLIDKHH